VNRTAESIDDLRTRVRSFIAANAPPIKVRRGHRAPLPSEIPALRAWTAALYREGFYGSDWPPEWGGIRDAHPLHQVAVVEELARANSPIPIGAGYLASRAIIAEGTEAQKRRYLPRIRSGEDLWCQLFSEPEAGSDLASLRTAARLDGDSYVIDGQKVWTTNGQHADLGFLLARSEPRLAKHAGITAFALDMHAPGITVRPLREITGTSDFNEVFLEDVRVSRRDVIGAPGAGWKVATEALAHERQSNAGLPIRLQLLFDDIVRLARAIPGRATGDPTVRQTLARSYIDVQVCRLLNLASLERVVRGSSGPVDGPMNKVFSSEVNLRLTELALHLGGPAALIEEDDPWAIDNGRWVDDFVYARAYPIAGGTNQIMRNLIAERGLGLPREPKRAG
jgi:alkylation response protein AidB-like acyl-CoA dehydrogenase